MKSAGKLLILILLFTSGVWAVESQGEFAGFTLSTCRADGKICATIKAEKALGSNFSALYMLSGPTLEMVNTKTNKKTFFKTASGYFDFQINRVVLMKEVAVGVFEETVLELDKMKISKTVMK